MSALHPFILVVIIVAAFVTFSVPKTLKDIAFSSKIGAAWAAIAIVMNAVFQWENASPVNLLLMNEKAGTFECILLSIGYAFLLRGFVGVIWHMFRSMR